MSLEAAKRGDCLSETEMSALSAGRPSGGRSQGQLVDHVAECEECRTLLSALARSQSMVSPKAGTPFAATEYAASETPSGIRSDRPPASGPGLRPSSRPPKLTNDALLVGGALLGQVVSGKYRLLRVLGAGGMGVVIAAQHLELGQSFALKFLHGESAASPDGRERFLREARASAQLRGEHAVRVTDTGVFDVEGASLPYFVMELLEGESLQSILKRKEPLALATSLTYVLQAAEALAEAHRLGIVHRDLKPDNLFVTRRADGSAFIKVVDFGISKQGHADIPSLTSQNVIMGTPRYMAPEQMRSTRDVDGRADVWALGVILYELLSGAPPFDATSITALITMVQLDAHVPLATRAPGVPTGVAEAVEGCLVKAPERRTPTVAALARALADYAPPSAQVHVDRILRLGGQERAASHASLGGQGPVPEPERGPAAARSRRVWGVAVGAAAMGALLMVGTLVGLGYRDRRTETRVTPERLASTAAAATAGPPEPPEDLAPPPALSSAMRVPLPLPHGTTTARAGASGHGHSQSGKVAASPSASAPGVPPPASTTNASDPHGLRTRN